MSYRQFPKSEEFVSNPGCRFKSVFQGFYDECGVLRLRQVDTVDLQAEYNAIAPTCDMSFVLARLGFGDASVLNTRKNAALYGDFTRCPDNMQEWLNLSLRAKDAFYSLSPEVRAQFNNDVSQFIATSGTESWFKNLGVLAEKLSTGEPAGSVGIKKPEKPEGDVKPEPTKE